MGRSTRRGIGALIVLGGVVVVVVLGLLLHPAQRVGAAELDHPVTVPIDVEHDGADTSVSVQVMIDGHGPYWFALDTGASTSAVSRSLAERLHLKDTGASAEFQTASGSTESELMIVRSWGVATLPLQRSAVISELDDGGGTDGLLGSDQLSRFGTVSIDYTDETLTVTPKH